MSSSVAQHPFLWLLAAFLLGVIAEWVLEIFFLRQRLFEAESRARRRGEDLDSERFVHNRTQAELKSRMGELETAQKERSLAESLLQATRTQLATAESERADAGAERIRLEAELQRLGQEQDSTVAEMAGWKAALQDAEQRLAGLQEECTTHQSVASESRIQLAQVAAELEATRQQIQRLEQDQADLAVTLRRLVELEGALAEGQSELASARSELDQVRQICSSLDAEKSALLGRIEKPETTATATRTASGAAEQKLKARAEEMKQLSQQLGEATEELSAVKSRYAQVQANLEAASATRVSLERELAAARKAATAPAPAVTPSAELADLREELTVQQRAAASWRSKAEELEAELLATSQAHQRLVQEAEGARSASPEPTVAAEALIAELDAMTRERNELAAELAALRADQND